MYVLMIQVAVLGHISSRASDVEESNFYSWVEGWGSIVVLR